VELLFLTKLTFNLGKKSSFLELGIGGTYWTGKSNASAYTETINTYQISPYYRMKKELQKQFAF